MDQLLKQLAAAAQAHTQPPLLRLPHFDNVHHPHAASALQLYAAAAGWAPFLAMNPLSSSNATDSSYREAATSGSASVHMLRHMALLQRANAAATKLQQLKEHEEQEQQQEHDVKLEAVEPTSRKLLQTEANEGK